MQTMLPFFFIRIVQIYSSYIDYADFSLPDNLAIAEMYNSIDDEFINGILLDKSIEKNSMDEYLEPLIKNVEIIEENNFIDNENGNLSDTKSNQNHVLSTDKKYIYIPYNINRNNNEIIMLENTNVFINPTIDTGTCMFYLVDNSINSNVLYLINPISTNTINTTNANYIPVNMKATCQPSYIDTSCHRHITNQFNIVQHKNINNSEVKSRNKRKIGRTNLKGTSDKKRLRFNNEDASDYNTSACEFTKSFKVPKLGSNHHDGICDDSQHIIQNNNVTKLANNIDIEKCKDCGKNVSAFDFGDITNENNNCFGCYISKLQIEKNNCDKCNFMKNSRFIKTSNSNVYCLRCYFVIEKNVEFVCVNCTRRKTGKRWYNDRLRGRICKYCFTNRNLSFTCELCKNEKFGNMLGKLDDKTKQICKCCLTNSKLNKKVKCFRCKRKCPTRKYIHKITNSFMCRRCYQNEYSLEPFDCVKCNDKKTGLFVFSKSGESKICRKCYDHSRLIKIICNVCNKEKNIKKSDKLKLANSICITCTRNAKKIQVFICVDCGLRKEGKKRQKLNTNESLCDICYYKQFGKVLEICPECNEPDKLLVCYNFDYSKKICDTCYRKNLREKRKELEKQKKS